MNRLATEFSPGNNSFRPDLLGLSLNSSQAETFAADVVTGSITEIDLRLQGFRDAASLSGHVVLQELLPTYFSTDGVGYSTNGHRTPGGRLIPDTEPALAPAVAILKAPLPKPVAFKGILFGAGRPTGDQLHTPQQPPAYRMNARLFIPTWMQVDHDGKPLVSEPPRLSMASIINEARWQSVVMAKKHPKSPITPAKAVDDVIRRSPTVLREKNMDPTVATTRQRAEVPSTIDPVRLYEQITLDFSRTYPLGTKGAPNIKPITDRLVSQLEDGRDPLRAYYRAAKEMIVLVWSQEDEAGNQAILRGRAVIRELRGYLPTLLEHRRAMREIAGAATRSSTA